jgi:hypothetical protein
LNQAGRFEPLPDDAGVLDRTTGLVWERAPGRPPLTWGEATCETGDARLDAEDGWRLPTIGELSDLAAALELGHPFEPADPQGVFWSTSESPFTRQHDVRGVTIEGGGRFAIVLLKRLARARRWLVRTVQTESGGPAARSL